MSDGAMGLIQSLFFPQKLKRTLMHIVAFKTIFLRLAFSVSPRISRPRIAPPLVSTLCASGRGLAPVSLWARQVCLGLFERKLLLTFYCPSRMRQRETGAEEKTGWTALKTEYQLLIIILVLSL